MATPNDAPSRSAQAPGASVNASSAAGVRDGASFGVATCVKPPGTPGRIVAGSTRASASRSGFSAISSASSSYSSDALVPRSNTVAGASGALSCNSSPRAAATGVARRQAFASASVLDRSKRAASNAAR
ncbi:hypothetical protein FEP57_05217 [Burkholderia multivorans]|nr:hypothetical protein [Burkholderia multivorans]